VDACRTRVNDRVAATSLVRQWLRNHPRTIAILKYKLCNRWANYCHSNLARSSSLGLEQLAPRIAAAVHMINTCKHPINAVQFI
jgi:hypothetical protein